MLNSRRKIHVDKMLPINRKWGRSLVLLGVILGLAGCAGDDFSDLAAYVNDVKARKAGRVAPLPEFKSYESYTYESAMLRDPFAPSTQETIAEAGAEGAGGLQPDVSRNKEPLEAFPLDALSFVGNLEQQGKIWAIITAPDGFVYRVQEGNYVGQNYGRIVGIQESKIDVREIVPNGLGGWIERDATLTLKE